MLCYTRIDKVEMLLTEILSYIATITKDYGYALQLDNNRN